MKTILKKTIPISFIILLTVISCSKEEEKKTTPVVIDGFTWSENGGSTQTADSAYFTSFLGVAYEIRVFKGSSFFNITVSDITPSTYRIDNIKGNALRYTVNTALFTAKTGDIIISSGSSTKISGSFTCTGSGASTSLTSISGTFNNIVKR
jgi:hypothetical protein